MPKQKNFKQEISKTQRYVRIKAALEEPLTEAYLSFCAFVAHDFELFLLPFQTKELMIHLLYPSMCKLLSKCLKKKVLSNESCANIELSKKENLKFVNLIDIGTKAKVMFADSNFFPDEKQTKFRKDCLQFYMTAINYLQEKLPFNVPILKHAQFLHPDKRNDSGATNSISNIASKICSVLKNYLSTTFSVSDPVTKEDVVHQIRSQWLLFQNEDLPEHSYLNTNDQKLSSSNQISYWKRAEEESGLRATANSKSIYKTLDCFWNHIGKVRDD